MKALINGEWFADIEDTPVLRQARVEARKSDFHGSVSADGSGDFPAATNRYHLYISYACPWAHRAVLYRSLKKLEDVISMSVLHPRWGGASGWMFADTALSTRDHVNGHDLLYQVYQAAKPDFTGKVTVPVLWDKKRQTIVNTESAEIIRMLNSEFDAWGDRSVDFYPAHLSAAIDTMNEKVLGAICMGVYAAGFASDQLSYDNATVRLFDELDRLEVHLQDHDFLVADQVTESDWHLFATLVRFDVAYYTKLKCTARRLIDYPNLSRYVRRLYELPGVSETVKLDHVKRHYFDDLGVGNPNIIPADPAIDFRNAS